MTWRSTLVMIVVVGGAAVCVRLGFWQLSRWHEKQAVNAALRTALLSPPRTVEPPLSPLDSVRGTKIQAEGRFDETRQVLLSGRVRNGAPGVEVVTPLLIGDRTTAILVNRGWLPSEDAATARPQEYPESGPRAVWGLAEPLRRGAGGPPVRALGAEDSVTLYSARWLDLDSLARRFPYALAPYVLRELPGPAAPQWPARSEPRPANEAMHLGYAVQWFLFAAIAVGGSAAVAWTRARHGPQPLVEPPRS